MIVSRMKKRWRIIEEYAGDTKKVDYYRPNQLSEMNIALVEAMGSKVALFSFSVADNTNALNNMVKNTTDGSIISLLTGKNHSSVLADYISQKNHQHGRNGDSCYKIRAHPEITGGIDK